MRIHLQLVIHLQNNLIKATVPLCVRTFAVFLITGLVLLGCASFNPQPLNDRPFRERATVQTKNGVRVLAAVLSAEETQSVFGLSLYKKGIQPVWLEIENNSQRIACGSRR
jgi:hypothetical protein